MTKPSGKAKKCGCNKKLGYMVCTKDGAKGKGGRGFTHHPKRRC